MKAGDPQSTPPIGIADVETVVKSTSGMVTHSLASSDRPDPSPDAIPGSVDVPARPEQATHGRQLCASLPPLTVLESFSPTVTFRRPVTSQLPESANTKRCQ